MEVAKLVKESRELLGMTQKELSKKVGFSDQFLGKIENGFAPLPLSKARKFVKTLGFTFDHLKEALIVDYTRKITKILK